MENMNQPSLILVDGSSYFYRAFHAFPPLTNPHGIPTGAMFGVLNMLRSLLVTYQPTHLVMVFDAKGKTFRDDIYSEYKANRPAMPDALRVQIEPLYTAIEAMGIPLLAVEGVEADDVIGTIAKQAAQCGQSVLISTGDKDLAQLVTDNITLINTMTNTILTPEGVIEKFGIPATKIIDYLALMGDSSDNIPGVQGIGKKTALSLLTEFAGLDDIYANLEKVAGLSIRGAKSLAEKLAQNRDMARLSYQLATIKTDVELALQPDDFALKYIDGEKVEAIFVHNGFTRWLKDIKAYNGNQAYDCTITELFVNPQKAYQIEQSHDHTESTQTGTSQPKNYHLILTQVDFDRWRQRLASASCFAVDTETDSLDYMTANLVGISFCLQSGEALYIPIGHDSIDSVDQLPLDEVLNQLKPILENRAIAKIGQNIKFDMSILARYGIVMQGIAFDTMLESYVLNSQSRHDMDSLAQHHLQYQTITYEEVVGKGKNQLTFNELTPEAAYEYAAEDADITWQLHQHLWAKLAQTPSLKQVFTEIEMPLVPILSTMERTGVRIDGELLKTHSQELAGKLAAIEAEVHQLAGETFNLSSTKQLQAILYDKLGLPVLKKTPKGVPSTNEEVLSELALDYPLPKVLLKYRGLAKLKNTYTDKLVEMVSLVDQRLHTSYNQTGTVTGRLSSSEPNLQNIPVRSEEGRRIRQAFIAAPHAKIVAADYSQIELRIMAHLSEDTGLITAFQRGEDIHRATAAEILGVTREQVSSEQRRRAKAINFGLIYGMSAFGLAKQLGIPRQEAQHYMDRYFDRYPGVLTYMESTRQRAAEQGFVETLFGRRLYLPDIHASNGLKRKGDERAAINAPMQGTAADIIKRAMIAIDQQLLSQRDDIKMIMQVHDELVFEIQESAIDDLLPLIRLAMENSANLVVPLKVDIGIGYNWDEAH